MNLTTVLVLLLIVAVIVIFALCVKKRPPEEGVHMPKVSNPPPRIPEVRPQTPSVPAKDAFLKNVNNFAPFLNQLNCALNREAWTEQIININNPLLIDIWRRSMHDAALWKRILSSWGLRQDTCRSFTFLDKYGNMYDTVDGTSAVPGEKYRVIDGCWVLTDEDTGSKTVVKKGKIDKL